MKGEMNAVTLDLKFYLQELRKNWVVIVLVTILGFLTGSLLTIIPHPDIYQATGSLSKTVVSSSSNLSIAMFSDLIFSKNVLDEVSSNLSEEAISTSELSSMLGASTNSTQNILYITARNTDPGIAIKVVNVATETMARQINELYANADVVVLDLATSAGMVSDEAKTATLYRFIGALLGAALCCVIIVVRILFSPKVLNIRGCTLDGEYPLVGVIPYLPADL